MQYVPPLGSTDPNASYVEGNPSAGIRGSFPTAGGYEAMMREIVNAIASAGLTPNATDLTQLAQAIKALIAQAFANGSITQAEILNITGGLGFSVSKKNGAFQPTSSGGGVSTLTYSFTAAAKGTVLAFSVLDTTSQSGVSNQIEIFVNGNVAAVSGDSVGTSTTDIATCTVNTGDNVTATSVVSANQALTYNTAQSFNMNYIPS